MVVQSQTRSRNKVACPRYLGTAMVRTGQDDATSIRFRFSWIQTLANLSQSFKKGFAIIWASPYSGLGIVIGLLGMLGGGRVRVRDGAIEFYGGGTQVVCSEIAAWRQHSRIHSWARDSWSKQLKDWTLLLNMNAFTSGSSNVGGL